jgi:hypothetical protein
LFPIARAVGVQEVHYAMVIILAMGIVLFAPLFGLGYYATCAGRGHSTNLGLSAGLDNRLDHCGDFSMSRSDFSNAAYLKFRR